MVSPSSNSADTKYSGTSITGPTLVMSMDDGFTVSSANAAWLEQTGWSSKELLGVSIDKFVAGTDHQKVTQHLKSIIDTGNDVRFDFQFLCKSGNAIWLQCIVTRVVSAGSANFSLIARPFGHVIPLEENKSHETELFGKAAQLAKFGYWSLDVKTQNLFWSKETYDIHGLDQREYTPTLETAISFYHPEDREEVRKAVELGLKENRPWQFQYRLVRPNGEVRIVRCSGVYDRESPSGASRIYGICQDVTDTEGLTEQVWLLSQVAQVSITGVTICDINKRVIWVNRTFQNISGYTFDEVRGKSLGQILQGADTSSETVKIIHDALDHQEDVDVEILNYHKNGTPYWNHLMISPLRKNGVVTHFVAIQHDITEQKQQQEVVSRRMKMQAIGQIAGKVCHDINNIMAIVSGNTQLLRLQEHSEKADKCIKNIEVATERATSLTRNLVTLVRERAYRQELTYIDQLVTNQVQSLKGELPARINLNIKRCAKCVVKTDKLALMDAIASLVSNAVEAIADDGKITIRTRCSDRFDSQLSTTIVAPRSSKHFALVEVTDTGHGIAEDELKRIFEPFYTTQGKRTGGGLGLSVLYEYCMHEGVGIQVTSQPDRGSTFSLWLPCEEDKSI